MKNIFSLLSFLYILNFQSQLFAQQFPVTISVQYIIPTGAGFMFPAVGNIQVARFTSQPYVRKVAATPDLAVGYLRWVIPNGIVSGHGSVVFQYFPTTNTINLPPGSAHITTWVGNQECRVYENGNCNCGNNAIWQICNEPSMAPYYVWLVWLAQYERATTITALTTAGFTVTQAAISDPDYEKDLKKMGIDLKNSTYVSDHALFQDKKTADSVNGAIKLLPSMQNGH